MNIQTVQISGQISGQVLNQAGNSLSGLQQQNGNHVPGQMQNPNIHRSVLSMDPEIVKIRRQMQERIWEFLMLRRLPSHEVPTKKMIDLVKRLENGLFQSAPTKEEYLDLGTLGTRLHILIRRRPVTNHNQQSQHTNSSPSIGATIPTPGFQQPGNTSLVGSSSLDSTLAANNSSNTITSSTVNSGSYLPTADGSAVALEGALASGYQHSSADLVNSGGSNLVAPMGDLNLHCGHEIHRGS